MVPSVRRFSMSSKWAILTKSGDRNSGRIMHISIAVFRFYVKVEVVPLIIL